MKEHRVVFKMPAIRMKPLLPEANSLLITIRNKRQFMQPFFIRVALCSIATNILELTN